MRARDYRIAIKADVRIADQPPGMREIRIGRRTGKRDRIDPGCLSDPGVSIGVASKDSRKRIVIFACFARNALLEKHFGVRGWLWERGDAPSRDRT